MFVPYRVAAKGLKFGPNDLVLTFSSAFLKVSLMPQIRNLTLNKLSLG